MSKVMRPQYEAEEADRCVNLLCAGITACFEEMIARDWDPRLAFIEPVFHKLNGPQADALKSVLGTSTIFISFPQLPTGEGGALEDGPLSAYFPARMTVQVHPDFGAQWKQIVLEGWQETIKMLHEELKAHLEAKAEASEQAPVIPQEPFNPEKEASDAKAE